MAQSPLGCNSGVVVVVRWRSNAVVAVAATVAAPAFEGRHTASNRRRRGLAPIELVLWLPILLFMAALMVNYGTLATWRVRAEVVSRDAAWRERWPRTGGEEGPPARNVWPADATMTTQPDEPLRLLDVAEIDHPVVRGPLPNGFVVQPILDPMPGAYRGVSEVNREYPMLPRLGDYNSGDVAGPLFDGKWQSAAMGIPNNYRRIRVLYTLPKTDPALPRAFTSAVQSVFTMPHFSALAVLDRDADIFRYTRRYVDFHPRVRGMCELERDTVRDRAVVPLVDIRLPNRNIRLGEISRLPRTMTNFFLSMYQAELQRLQDELAAIPPPSPQRRAQILAEIAILQPKIEQLEDYLARLPAIENNLRASADAALP